MLPLVFRKATLVEENQQFYPKTYCDFVIRMTLEALMCVYTPWPPPPTTTPTTHTHTFTAMVFCFVKAHIQAVSCLELTAM